MPVQGLCFVCVAHKVSLQVRRIGHGIEKLQLGVWRSLVFIVSAVVTTGVVEDVLMGVVVFSS